MWRRRGHHHDRLANGKPAMAMDHQRVAQRPAGKGLFGDGADRTLRHARIMLDQQCLEAAVEIAHEAGKGNDCPRTARARGEIRHLGAQVERIGLDADPHPQPPVIGGKKATSRTPARGEANPASS